MDGLGFRFLDWAYYRGILHCVADDVDDETIGLYEVLAKRHTSTVANVSTMDVGGSFTSDRTYVPLESTSCGASY